MDICFGVSLYCARTDFNSLSSAFVPPLLQVVHVTQSGSPNEWWLGFLDGDGPHSQGMFPGTFVVLEQELLQRGGVSDAGAKSGELAEKTLASTNEPMMQTSVRQ